MQNQNEQIPPQTACNGEPVLETYREGHHNPSTAIALKPGEVLVIPIHKASLRAHARNESDEYMELVIERIR